MKLLRNIGIYYIILTLVAFALSFYAVLYLFIPLLPILILGILFIITSYIIKNKHKNKLVTKLSKLQLGSLTIFLIILPFILYVLTSWYIFRLYKQTIIIPQNYEGVVAIQYNKPNGQPKKWINGFFGFGSSRLIVVDSMGIAETQFDFHNNAIPILGVEQTFNNRGGMKIQYENDLDNQINFGKFYGIDMNEYSVNASEMKNLPNIYFTGYDYYPLMIFVITKPTNYNEYFMSKEEMINEYKEKYKKPPDTSKFSLVRKLNEKYKLY